MGRFNFIKLPIKCILNLAAILRRKVSHVSLRGRSNCHNPLPVVIALTIQDSAEDAAKDTTISIFELNFNQSNSTFSAAELFVDNFSKHRFPT